MPVDFEPVVVMLRREPTKPRPSDIDGSILFRNTRSSDIADLTTLRNILLRDDTDSVPEKLSQCQTFSSSKSIEIGASKAGKARGIRFSPVADDFYECRGRIAVIGRFPKHTACSADDPVPIIRDFFPG